MAYSDLEKDQIFDDVIEEIIEGRSLRSILKDKGMPSASNFLRWLSLDELKQKQYARACEARADYLFEQTIEIANNTEAGTETTVDHNGIKIVTKDMLGHRRLKIDAIHWHISKMNPKKYGNKIDLTTDGDKIENAAPVWAFINAEKTEDK
jgi:hypothetical protein